MVTHKGSLFICAQFTWYCLDSDICGTQKYGCYGYVTRMRHRQEMHKNFDWATSEDQE